MKHFDKKQGAILLVALFALAACQNPLDPPENVSGGNAAGNVIISIGEGSTARTLSPDYTALSGLAYQLTFSGGTSYAEENLSFGTLKTVRLAPGNWTITAQAKDGDTVKAEGSWTGAVSASDITVASITLLPKTGSGNGTLAYTVTFPNLGTDGSKSLALYPVTESDEMVGILVTNFTSGTSDTKDLPAGFYRLGLSLTNSAGKTAARTDAVHIYAGLTTTAAFDFAGTDFREELDGGLYVGESGTAEDIASFNLSNALEWLKNNAASNTAYTIVLGADENVSAKTLDTTELHGASNVSITLWGKGAERTIQINGSGSLFTIDTGVTLILDQNITLTGGDSNSGALVTVKLGGTLEMWDGAKITGGYGGGVWNNSGTFTMKGGEISGNTSSTHGYGGGVFNANSGIFTMTGGEISGNTSSGSYGYGGGVYNTGTFIMEGGEISGNTTRGGSGSNGDSSYGGGVYNSGDGIFTMTGGEISGNTASGGNSSYGGNDGGRGCGGGVYNDSGTFTMIGGEISGNTASGGSSSGNDRYANGGRGGGGGVCNDSGTFTMIGGEISGNTASGGSSSFGSSGSGVGGGVYNSGDGTFTMEGGEISDNTASGVGGGVYNSDDGTFIMEDGEISGNTASGGDGVYYGGGGVYNAFGTFTKTSGVIYGDTDTTHTAGSTENTVLNGYGHAVFSIVNDDVIWIRNSTAGTSVNLDSGTAENWE